jgi:hypothetical protein
MLRSVFIDLVYGLALVGLGLAGIEHAVTRDDVASLFKP